MKCPHCGKEHPDDFKVCPYTAKPIEAQSQYCKNEGCDFRSPLPLTAKFCPNCGKPLKQSETDNCVSIPFCCMIETTEEKFLTMFSHLTEMRKYKFLSNTGESLSEHEFYIVSKSEKEFNNTSYIHQLLLFEVKNNHLFYIDAKGILTKLGQYGDEECYREGRSYWDHKWQYDAEIMDESHILYRNGTTYSLYCIDSDGIPVLKNRFSTKLHNLCREELIGDYICTDKASIRISDGCYETIPGYKRCRCIGYDNYNPIFAASNDTNWAIDDMDKGCDIVALNGKIVWHCHYHSIEYFSNNQILVIDNNDDQGLLSLSGQEIIPIGDYGLLLTPYKDIIEIYKNRESGAYSISRKKSYFEFEPFGDYYGLIEKINGGFHCSILSPANDIAYQLKTGDIDDMPCTLLSTKSGQYVPLCLNFKGEIVALDSSKVIYHYDEESDEFIGVSKVSSRFAVQNSSVIEIIDFDGNILNRLVVKYELDNSVSMCSNGYILLYNPRKKEIRYYDLDCNEYILKVPNLTYNNPKDLYAGDMMQNGIISLHNGGRKTCVILTTSGNIIYDDYQLDVVTTEILKGIDLIVNLEGQVVIKDCKIII